MKKESGTNLYFLNQTVVDVTSSWQTIRKGCPSS